MTQKSEITSYLLKNPYATTRQIRFAFVKFPYASVRRVLSGLRKEGLNIKANIKHENKIKDFLVEKARQIIEAVKPPEVKEEEEEEELFRRKIIKLTVYCPDDIHRAGFGRKVFALTYEDNDEDRSQELIDELQLSTVELEQGLMDKPTMTNLPTRGNRAFTSVKDCKEATEFGYDDEMETDKPPVDAIYPKIEVGEE